MSARVTLEPLIALRLWSRTVAFPPRQRVSAHLAGSYASLRRGRGIDFDEVRCYQPGDDIRSMDWRVTARTGHPYTKVFREERERPVYLLVDYQPSMHFGSRRVTKRVLAAELAALYAWAARRNGDRVGVILVSPTGNRELPPAGGDRGVLRLLHHLVDTSPPHSASRLDGTAQPLKGAASIPSTPASPDSPKAASGFVLALERLWHLTHPGDAVLIISDFYSLTPAAERLLGQLAGRSDITLIQVSDPLERCSPPVGTYPVFDGNAPVFWQVGTARVDPVARLFEARNEQLETLCRTHAMHRITCGTELPLPEQRTMFRPQHTASRGSLRDTQEGRHG